MIIIIHTWSGKDVPIEGFIHGFQNLSLLFQLANVIDSAFLINAKKSVRIVGNVHLLLADVISGVDGGRNVDKSFVSGAHFVKISSLLRFKLFWYPYLNLHIYTKLGNPKDSIWRTSGSKYSIFII